MSEAEIFARLPGYRVFVDTYPTAAGVEDHEIGVAQDVGILVSNELAICRQRTGILIGQVSKTEYGARRFRELVSFLGRDDVENFITATVTKETEPPETVKIKVEEPHLGANPSVPAVRVCFELETRPAGSIEVPLGQIGDLNAAHALFLSFERGEQAPFSNPSVNILKFGYRIRARGFLIR